MTTTAGADDIQRVLSEEEVRAIRRGAPSPRVPMPAVALPTVGLFVGALALWGAATWVVLADLSPWWLLATIPAHVVATYVMFTVVHETVHLAGGSVRWANEVLGRVSMVFVFALASFPVFRFIHVEHHRHTNEGRLSDPDAWSELGPKWALPLRWLTQDLYYFHFYLLLMRRRPRAEVVEQLVVLALMIAVFATLVTTGHGWELLVVYVIPQRLGIGLLAWWFDWMPHHELEATATTDRFHATRIRAGWEWLMSPVFLYQNYHLVHHIHPTIPFYRYVQAWRRAESDYLDREVPIATAWGTELSAAEYRAWRGITKNIDRDADLPHRPHRLRVAEVRALTPDAVSITFDVPAALREAFDFRPGQNVVVGADIDGEHVRRTYSVCTAAGSGVLRIAVRRTEGGRFSTWATTGLRAGDELEVTPPGGRFTLTPAPRTGRHIAAVAAGSGITPVISIVASALTAEPGTRATLLYANRDAGSTMFGDELAMLTRQFEGRLRIVHHHSRATAVDTAAGTVAGRLDAVRLREHLDDPRLVAAEWFLCGPAAMLDTVETVLGEQGVPRAAIHRELFVAPEGETDPADLTDVVAADVTVTCGGEETVVRSEGTSSLLETVLAGGLDVPYLCAGGICGTCRATVTRGTVHMQQNYVLTDDEVADGAVLTCQSRPTSPEVDLDYDR